MVVSPRAGRLRSSQAPRVRTVQLRITTAVIASLTILAAACGGNDEPPAEATPAAVPTATPLAAAPQPTIIAASGPAAPLTDVTYVVSAGDSLSQIASRFDTTVDAIMERNGLTSFDIFIGQQLLIPQGDEESEPGGPNSDDPDVYVVRAGDTAASIAARFNTTLAELAAVNGISVADLDRLDLGQELLLPRPR